MKRLTIKRRRYYVDRMVQQLDRGAWCYTLKLNALKATHALGKPSFGLNLLHPTFLIGISA